MSDTVGQPQDAAVVIERTVSVSVKDFWKALVTKAGSEVLLGSGGVLGDKGDSWKAADGSFGVVRSYHPLERIRFTWHAKEGATKTMVIVSVTAADGGTLVRVEHADVPEYYDKEALAKRWAAAVAGIVALV